MSYFRNMRRAQRKARCSGPDLFSWARDQQLLADPSVAQVTRRARVSPAVRALLAELAGITREDR